MKIIGRVKRVLFGAGWARARRMPFKFDLNAVPFFDNNSNKMVGSGRELRFFRAQIWRKCVLIMNWVAFNACIKLQCVLRDADARLVFFCVNTLILDYVFESGMIFFCIYEVHKLVFCICSLHIRFGVKG